MQIENFKIFADLVETKSFSKSAKLNGITQSAVSQQARAMERHFKTLLIDRSQKQFQLTREGQRVYESANEILHTYEKLLSELQEMKKVISGTNSILDTKARTAPEERVMVPIRDAAALPMSFL